MRIPTPPNLPPPSPPPTSGSPRRLAWLLGAVCTALATAASAEVALDELDPGVAWRVGGIEVEGGDFFSEGEIEEKMVTEERSWYAFWRRRPAFDPAVFARDLERLERFYESEGFFEARVGAALTTEEERVYVRLEVAEGARAEVASLEVEVELTEGAPSPPDGLPLETGMPFTEEAYRAGQGALRTFYANRGRAHARVERSARVSADGLRVDVAYHVRPGPPAVFGETRIEGLTDVAAEIVRRELAYAEGEGFSLTAIERSRSDLLATNLFASVRFEWPSKGEPRRVPIRLRVQERPLREIRVGVTYSTEDELGAQLRWQHYNWLGGGRQLSLSGRYALITSSAEVAFVQPHLFDRRNRGLVNFLLFHQDEETFTLDSSQLTPAFERALHPTLDASVGYRLQWAHVTGVDLEVEQAIGGVRSAGWIFGPQLGVLWDRTDDPLAPTSGHTLSLSAFQAGGPWSGEYAFYRLGAQAAQYWSPGFDTVLAGRLRVGFADALGAEANLPIFERFFAGGEKSVRGYARRRLGPKSSTDDPLGGKSLIEGSIELRRPLPIVGGLGALVFLDFGQVSLERFDPPVDDLEFSAGPGLTYATPVGPLALYVGFPFDPPAGDAAWQLHFSIGHFF